VFDGRGAGTPTIYCDTEVPSGWVTNNADTDDNCFSNILDCAGEYDGSAIPDACDECNGPGPVYGSASDCCAADVDCDGVCGGNAQKDNCGICGGSDECFGCSDWYMNNFICDVVGGTGKCCLEDDDNSDYKCKLASTDGTNCKVLEQGDPTATSG
jgi:hypothetical protein